MLDGGRGLFNGADAFAFVQHRQQNKSKRTCPACQALDEVRVSTRAWCLLAFFFNSLLVGGLLLLVTFPSAENTEQDVDVVRPLYEQHAAHAS